MKQKNRSNNIIILNINEDENLNECIFYVIIK